MCCGCVLVRRGVREGHLCQPSSCLCDSRSSGTGPLHLGEDGFIQPSTKGSSNEVQTHNKVLMLGIYEEEEGIIIEGAFIGGY